MNWRRGNKGVLECSWSVCSVASNIDINSCNLVAASLIFTRTKLYSSNSGKFKISKLVIRLSCKGTCYWQLTAETVKSD